MGSVKFVEPIRLPAPPAVVAAGQVAFTGTSTADVSFQRALTGPYYIALCGNGAGSGQMADPHETFSVISRGEWGFKIRCSTRVTRSTVDWVVVQ